MSLCVAMASASAWAVNGGQIPCGDVFHNHFGPFEYARADAATRSLVENAHFTAGVERMTEPSTTTFREMAGDVAYTLHVFPNHHRALVVMDKLAEKWGTDPAPGARRTVECYYTRAIQFRPKDTISRALYALYLDRKKRHDEAVVQLDAAVQLAEDSAQSHYNLGRVFFDIGEYERALKQAHTAASLGWPLTDLQERLKEKGKWSDPPAAEAPASAASQ